MDKPSEQRIYEFDDFRIDALHLIISRRGKEIRLAPKAVETLLALVERSGQVVSKDELLEAVWPDTVVEESNLFAYLSHLRKALGNRANGEPYVETLRRRGYRFTGNARVFRSIPDEGNYAWVVDDPVDGTTGVQNQSGRMYVLKDSGRSRSNSARRAFKPIEQPADELAQADDFAREIALSPGVARAPNRSRNWIWAGAIVVILVVFAAGFFLPRLLNTASLATPRVSMLTNGVDVQGSAITRDGKKFVYHTNDDGYSRLFLQQAGELKAIEIISRTNAEFGSKSFSPDGSYVYYLLREIGSPYFSLYRIPTLGGQSMRLLDGIFDYSSISFSPDGSKIVVARLDKITGSSITIANANGGGESDILSSRSEWLTYPAWSPDGLSIAFARMRPRLKPKDQFVSIESIGPAGGTPMLLVQEKLANCFRIEWTSSGDGLVFGGTKLGEQMTGRRDQVWFVSLSNGKLLRISPEGDRYTFDGLSADNTAIATRIKRSSQLWAMDANGDSVTARQLTRGTTDGRTGIAPLPDGRIGFMTRNGDDWEIWTINNDGSNPTQVFDANPTADELRATPDGKFFVFNSEVDGNNQLFRVNSDGSDLRQLTFGDQAYSFDSSPSADSRSVILVSVLYDQDHPSAGLYRVSVDGGEIEQVRTESAGPHTPHASPDGRYLSYVDTASSPKRLVVQSLADGSSRSYAVPETTALNIGALFTPDSRSLAYIVFNSRAANVWLQPLDGRPPRQLTNFSSGRIFRIAYATDGKTLYLARSHDVNEAILIKGFVN